MLKRLGTFLRNTTAPAQLFLKDKRGNASLIFGVTSIPLAMIASMAVDYGNGVRIKSELQAAVDAGVLAAATALASGEDNTSKTQIAETTFYANLSDNTLDGFTATPTTNVNFPDKEVTMSVNVSNGRMVSTLLSDHMDIGVTATAIVSAGNPICMMSLNETERESLYLNGTADVIANGCSIHVNSNDEEALRQIGGGTATAESFCVNGDYVGSNYTPMPRRRCRKEEDPLDEYFATDWATVDTSVCDFQAGDVITPSGPDMVLLEPGVYCGTLSITAGKTAIIQGNDEVAGGDSLYIFLNGGIDIAGGGTLRNFTEVGDTVTPAATKNFPAETAIILAGNAPAGNFEMTGGANGANITLKAKASGTFAGIALAQHPDSVNANKDHVIAGGGNVNIDGIVYFPTQSLNITGNGVIGNSADQFAIIANMIEVDGTGSLEIRIGADYSSAGLPELPESSEMVRLVD